MWASRGTKFFGTADYQEAAGKPVGRTRFVVGLRLWM